MSDTDKSGRHALWGAIFGALVGGVLSFLGSYFTNQTQEQRQHEDLKRVAYAKVISQAEEHRTLLMRVEKAAKAKDPQTYKEVYDKSWENASELYAVTAEASMLLSVDEYNALWRIPSEYFKAPVVEKYQELDIKAVNDARQKGTAAMKDFVSQGRNEFKENEPNLLERIFP